ncbi:hypothetical protein KL86PLE_70108 [uncultured Pleomorphomonas sp.]|uniref:Uncharacterized protein n=1 Tax=uncultured Pleomorphomonas sp. TaxID=442121 RepID=A0A212LLP9_9HYPH|nr:hypothetical protein KL86PLE_70108 [uncultured Pleomorphomonas sp.]
MRPRGSQKSRMKFAISLPSCPDFMLFTSLTISAYGRQGMDANAKSIGPRSQSIHLRI